MSADPVSPESPPSPGSIPRGGPAQIATGVPHAAGRRRAWRPSTRVRVVSDVAVFAFFLALSAPTTTGLAVHEWLVVPFVPVFLGHLVTSWSWVTAMVRRGARPRGRPRTNRTLDVLLFVLVVTAVWSGFAISVDLVPAFGLHVVPRAFWVGLHTASATLLVPIIAAHLLLHWRWVRHHVLRAKSATEVSA